MTAQIAQGQIQAGVQIAGSARVSQGAVLIALSFVPPVANPRIAQAQIQLAARRYPIHRTATLTDPMVYPCVCGCAIVPYFTRKTDE